MRSDYAGVFTDPAVVDKYEREVYAPGSYASAIDRRQRRYLRELVRRAFPRCRPVQHDFACGTGRALRLLRGRVRSAHGYDTSHAMLAEADRLQVRASLHRVAASGPVPEPVRAHGPAIVTVFRTLLNADEPTRDRAIAFAARVLPGPAAGLLVVENHGNRSSLRHLRRHRRAKETWFEELSHTEVAALLATHGFRVVERRGFALLTKGCYARRWLRPLAWTVDTLAARLPFLAPWSVNVLYIARRDRSPRNTNSSRAVPAPENSTGSQAPVSRQQSRTR